MNRSTHSLSRVLTYWISVVAVGIVGMMWYQKSLGANHYQYANPIAAFLVAIGGFAIFILTWETIAWMFSRPTERIHRIESRVGTYEWSEAEQGYERVSDDGKPYRSNSDPL
jgi:hypothetical protein